MRQILATGNLVPQRFRTFLFRGERYVTHHMAAGKTAKPLRLGLDKRPYGGLHINIISGCKNREPIIPAEIVYPEGSSLVTLETKGSEYLITTDPLSETEAKGAMPRNVKTLTSMMAKMGLPLAGREMPSGLNHKKISAVFFSDLRDYIDKEGRIDHVALLLGEIGAGSKLPRYAAQMYFSTLAEWDGFSRGVKIRY